MASQGSGAGDQQQGGSNLPEDVWWDHIDDMYPNLQGQTYFLPPYHFNRVPFTVNVIAGLTARVTAACCQKKKKKKKAKKGPQQTASTAQAQGSQQTASTAQAQGSQQTASTAQAQGSQQTASTAQAQGSQQTASTAQAQGSQQTASTAQAQGSQQTASTAQAQGSQQTASTSQAPGSQQPASTSQAQGSQQVAGTLYTQNPPTLLSHNVTPDDAVDDQAQEACLRALHDISGETMMVISQLLIKNYLEDNNPDLDRCHLDAISQLPTPAGLPSNLADGEMDVLIIHPDHGLLLGEVKSVGSKPSFSDDHHIVKKVEQAIRQLHKQKAALKHLLNDLPWISITKAVLLPNLKSSQLSSALSSSESLKQDLIACTKSVDVNQAISRCLCSDNLSAWWQNVWSVSQPLPSPQLYKRLVARFCGIASTIDIPTACTPRVVVRSLGQAVAETGLRFSALILMPEQVELLDKHPPPQYLYLQGPPGTGKTLMLFLAALKSTLQGKKVVIVHTPGDVAVATLLQLQFISILGKTTAARLIHLHPCDFRDHHLDVNADVATLQQQVGQVDDVHIIVDEAPYSSIVADRQFLRWVTAVGSKLPQALLWMAGLVRRDHTAHQPRRLPPWVATTTLRVSLRCPPAVTAEVEEYDDIDDRFIPRYVTPADPQHTAGPDVRRLLHTEGDDGHTVGLYDYLNCEPCSDNVAAIIKELGVGQPGHRLQYRDVFILTGLPCPAPPRDGDVFVQRLRQHHRLPVRVVEVSVSDDGVMTTPPSADDALHLAKADDDNIAITHWAAVQGLERRVVFVLGGYGVMTEDCVAVSRSTAFLCYIT